MTAVAVLPPNPLFLVLPFSPRCECEAGFASVYLFLRFRQLFPSLLQGRTRGRRRRKEKKRKYILGKRPRERLLAADLLPADEGVDRDGDGAVDVLRRAVFRQAHLAKGLADAHDGFEGADLGDGLLVPFFFLL